MLPKLAHVRSLIVYEVLVIVESTSSVRVVKLFGMISVEKMVFYVTQMSEV